MVTMPFGRKRHDAPAFNEVHVVDGMRTTALIIETGDPIDDEVIPHGDNVHDTATTRILVDVGTGPILLVQELMLVPDRWLVRGMRIPVTVEPRPPHAFEVDWDAIASMAQRVAAGDPTLVDPLGTKRAVSEALTAAGLPGIDMLEMPPAMAAATAPAQEQQLDLTERNFIAKLTAAAALPAPAGKARALVLIAANAVSFKRWQFGGGDDHLDLNTTRIGTHDAVLSVHLPGQAPYAVFIAGFTHEKRVGDPLHPGLPALVSTTDPHDVVVLWDEIETRREQQAEGHAAGKAANRAGRKLQNQMPQRIAEALEHATPPPVPAAGPMPQMNQAALEQAGRTALAIITDPAQRQMIIDQYRMMGIDLD
jgi:hypothetical protein